LLDILGGLKIFLQIQMPRARKKSLNNADVIFAGNVWICIFSHLTSGRKIDPESDKKNFTDRSKARKKRKKLLWCLVLQWGNKSLLHWKKPSTTVWRLVF